MIKNIRSGGHILNQWANLKVWVITKTKLMRQGHIMKKHKMNLVILHALILFSLSGCGGANFNEKAVVKSQKIALPDVVEYTKGELNEAADELEKCTDCNMIDRLLLDFRTMRRQTRYLKSNL